MKVLVKGCAYVVAEAHADHLEIVVEPGLTALVPYDEPTLIVDPTDDDLREAKEALVGHAGCQHANYMTIDLPMGVHECQLCGSHFTDTRRPKRYFYYKGQRQV
jgi:hypothetical protein